MRTNRIFLAAVAATLLSTAAFAVPSASQVSVPAGADMSRHEAKMNALFSSPEERMMFRAQMHQEMRGMPKDQRKAYRRQAIQKIRAMNQSERTSWLHDLDAKWSAMPADRRERMEAKLQRHETKHEAHAERRNGGQQMNQAPQQ